MCQFFEFPKKQPPKKDEYYMVAVTRQDDTKLMYVAKWKGKKFSPHDPDISHYSEMPLHPSVNFDERRRVWALQVYEEYKDQYPVDMLRKFCRYWGEVFVRGRDKGKLRWEGQNTWQLHLRLKTWNDNNISNQDDRRPERITIK